MEEPAVIVCVIVIVLAGAHVPAGPTVVTGRTGATGVEVGVVAVQLSVQVEMYDVGSKVGVSQVEQQVVPADVATGVLHGTNFVEVVMIVVG